MRKCQCPSCSANLQFGDDREFGFCEYCGTKVILDDYRSMHRVVDEAAVKRAETERIVRISELETERMIRMRELDIEEQEDARNRKSRKKAFNIALIFGAVGALFLAVDSENLIGLLCIAIAMYIGVYTLITGDEAKTKREQLRNSRAGLIKLTYEVSVFEKKDVHTVEAGYRSLGFVNVDTVNMQDLRIGILKKPGQVENVTINGQSPCGGQWYNPRDIIVITYHGLPEN